MQILKLYALRKKVSFSISSHQILLLQANNQSLEEQEVKLKETFPENLEICFTTPDPRHEEMPSRIIFTHEKNNVDHSISSSQVQQYAQMQQQGLNQYLKQKFTLGLIDEFELEIEKSVPNEYGLEFLNAINFKKGCFLGQELIARTKHTGVVRKKVFYGVMLGESPADYKNAFCKNTVAHKVSIEIYNEHGAKVGKVLSYYLNYAICMIKGEDHIFEPDMVVKIGATNDEYLLEKKIKLQPAKWLNKYKGKLIMINKGTISKIKDSLTTIKRSL